MNNSQHDDDDDDDRHQRRTQPSQSPPLSSPQIRRQQLRQQQQQQQQQSRTIVRTSPSPNRDNATAALMAATGMQQSALRQLASNSGNRGAAASVTTSSSRTSSSTNSAAASSSSNASATTSTAAAAAARRLPLGASVADIEGDALSRSDPYVERRAIPMDAAAGGRDDNMALFGNDNRHSIPSASYHQGLADVGPSRLPALYSHHRQQQQQHRPLPHLNHNDTLAPRDHDVHGKEGWTHVPSDPASPGRPPRRRSLHAAAVLRDSLYVFGGYDGLDRVNDFYEFHFPSGSWREIIALNVHAGENGAATAAAAMIGPGGGLAGAAAAAAGHNANLRNQHDNNQQQQQQQNDPTNRPYGATATATGAPPSPRDRHAAVVHGSSFYVFGGFDGTSRVSDLHGFDADTMRWREVRPRLVGDDRDDDDDDDDDDNVGDAIDNDDANAENDAVMGAMPQQQRPHNQQPHRQHPQQPQRRLLHPPPSPRHSHAAVVHSSKLYVFGGYDGSYRSDFHSFDLVRKTWRPVDAAGRSPRARYRSTACVMNDRMILFGGHDGTRHLADVHVFDFTARAWSLLNCGGVPPLPRDSHVSVVYGESMYVFGGSTGSAMNDLYELNFRPSARRPSESNEGGGGGAPAEDGHGPEVGAGTSVAAQDAAAAAAALAASPAEWRQVPLAAGGIAVHRFCHVGAVHSGSLYVFGGYDGSSRLNDFVSYDLAAEAAPNDADVPASTLLGDLRSFLDDEEVMSLADITLVVEGVPVRAHKLMLMRCPYFRAMLLGDAFAESTQSVVNLEIVRHPIFLAVLEYLYTDSVAITLESAMELFVAADCFDIPRLQAMCERRLLESMTVENAATIFHAADVHSARTLRDKALAYVLGHFEAVSKTVAFEDMARSNVELVFEILKSR